MILFTYNNKFGGNNMRRLFLTALVLVAVFVMSGCSSGKDRWEISEDIQKLGVAAVEAADDFLDGKIDGYEAQKRLKESRGGAKYKNDNKKEELNVDSLSDTEYFGDYLIESNISSLYMDVYFKTSGTGTEKDIIESRNALAEKLDMKER